MRILDLYSIFSGNIQCLPPLNTDFYTGNRIGLIAVLRLA